jgi:hypothetical protein
VIETGFRYACREQLIEEPIDSGADKTDQAILEHRSAVQRCGYSLGEAAQVVEKRIDLSTLELTRALPKPLEVSYRCPADWEEDV